MIELKYTNTHMMKSHRINTHTNKWVHVKLVEIQIRSVGYINVNFLVMVLFCTMIMEDVTFGENWMKCIHDPSVLFLTVACESTIISK